MNEPIEIKFIQPMIAENMQHAIWYGGEIATLTKGDRKIDIYALQEIYVKIDGEVYKNENAADQLRDMGYTDETVGSCGRLEFEVSSWFDICCKQNGEGWLDEDPEYLYEVVLDKARRWLEDDECWD